MRSVFLQRNKAVFDVTKLPTDEYAASLGLLSAPKVKVVEVRDVAMILRTGTGLIMDAPCFSGPRLGVSQRAKQLKNQPRKAVALKHASAAAAPAPAATGNNDDNDDDDDDVAVSSDDDSDGAAAAEDDSSDEDGDDNAGEGRAAAAGDDAAPHRNPVRRPCLLLPSLFE